MAAMPKLICAECGKHVIIKSKNMKLIPYLDDFICSADCFLHRIQESTHSGLSYIPRPDDLLSPGHIWCKETRCAYRSGYEAIFAKFLKRKEIAFKYEPYTFWFGSATYTPDFYIPAYDYFVEVKGVWGFGKKKKMEAFSVAHPKVNIVIAPWLLRSSFIAS